MQPRFLEKRVEIVERLMEGLEGLPARVEAVEEQILQLRGEMRTEFSAVREEIRAGDDETRRHMRMLNEEQIARIQLIAAGHSETQRQVGALRDEMTARFGKVDVKFDHVTARLEAIHKQLMPRRRARKR